MTRLQMLIYSLNTPEAESLARAASQARVEVFHTADGRTASEWLRHRKFDGVVVDSTTPGAAGVLQDTMLSASNSRAATLSVTGTEDIEGLCGCTSLTLWRGGSATAMV